MRDYPEISPSDAARGADLLPLLLFFSSSPPPLSPPPFLLTSSASPHLVLYSSSPPLVSSSSAWFRQVRRRVMDESPFIAPSSRRQQAASFELVLDGMIWGGAEQKTPLKRLPLSPLLPLPVFLTSATNVRLHPRNPRLRRRSPDQRGYSSSCNVLRSGPCGGSRMEKETASRPQSFYLSQPEISILRRHHARRRF